MVDGHNYALFPKGGYAEPSNVMNTLLRGESKFKTPFKLFHRSLRTNDKGLVLG